MCLAIKQPWAWAIFNAGKKRRKPRLANPVKFITPIPASGRLGIFPLEASIADQVQVEYAKSLQAMPVAN